jgi:hypothetical protein
MDFVNFSPHLQSTCPYFPSAEVLGVHHHMQYLTEVLEENLNLIYSHVLNIGKYLIPHPIREKSV